MVLKPTHFGWTGSTTQDRGRDARRELREREREREQQWYSEGQNAATSAAGIAR